MSSKSSSKSASKKSGPGDAQEKKTKITKLKFEKERDQFKALVLTNPNYFGNLKNSQFQPVLKIQNDNSFEEIGCVGFQPQFNRLEAVVFIKQASGYGGGVCTNGTPEFVRFYLSFDDGATWEDQGLTSFAAYNIPGTTEERRLEYAVTLQVNPPKKFCFFRNVVLARAILSWNVPPPPNEPDFPPVWGDVHDTHIQIDPLKIFFLADVFQALKINTSAELPSILDLEQPITASEPKALSARELQKLYRGKKVEPHRFAFAEVKQLINQPGISESLMSQGSKGALAGLGIDLGKIIDKFFPVDGDTSFEELDCVGLNPNQDTLVGVIRVKLSSGYSGGPCTAGSKEYVTFWADFDNNGTFETCLGTASVTVYDIDNIPKGGLEYAVSLPIDLTHRRQPCEDGPKVVRIRAILSWQEIPPCNNPNFIPTWGNREETTVHITPGPEIPVGAVIPKLSILGGIPVTKIGAVTGTTTNDAVFAINNLPPDSLGRPCPFGGRVAAQGPQYPGFKYHVQVRKIGTATWTTVTTPLKVVDQDGNLNDHFPDASGKFDFLPFTQNIGNLLALWDTSGDDLWVVRLQVFTLFDVLLPGVASHRMQLDNTGPDANVDIESGPGNCGKFKVGVLIKGHFVARDANFGSFGLGVKPNINPPGVGVPSPHSGTVQTALPPGDEWTLDTTGMKPCGYIIEVGVSDRAIVNSSGPGSGHSNSDAAGFCLE
jgi:hypothetical protein